MAGSVKLLPITTADVPAVAKFLHAELRGRIASSAWQAAMIPPWDTFQPNHGFLLQDDERIVGVHLAFYSEREIEGRLEQFCNLAAWCVLEDYRSFGLRLLNALLAQQGYHFTDLSPSGNVVPLNRRLKFVHLDVATALVPNLPWPFWSSRVRLITAAHEIEGILLGRDLEIYRDHAKALAAYHLVVVKDQMPCYVMFRRVRRKNLPLFASILYVGDRELFSTVAHHVFRHLLFRHAIPITLAEIRIVGRQPKPSIMLKSPRPKMYRSSTLDPSQIDNLYSELTCVVW